MEKTLNRRTWAIMYVAQNPDLAARLPRIAAEVTRLGLWFSGPPKSTLVAGYRKMLREAPLYSYLKFRRF